MRQLFFFLFINISLIVSSQEMIVDWGECFGANYSNSYGRAIDVLPNENIVTTIVITDYNEAFTDYHGDADAWVLILDNTGNIVNDKCFGGGAEDVFQDIEVYDDYIYFIGYTQSTDGDVQSEPVGGYVDLWVVKTDFDLNIIWERRYGCLGTQQFESAKVTEEGGLVLLMDFFGSGGGDVSQYYGDTDIWVCEIDANGDILWEKTLGNTEGNYASNVLLLEDNKTIIIGETNYSGGMVECNCNGMRDIWVIELDNNTQEILWQGCYGGSENDAASNIIKVNDSYFITGVTLSIDGDISNNHGGMDLWIIQIDDGGQLIWEKCFGGSENDGSRNIYKTEDNGYLLFGTTSSRDGDVNNTNCPYSFCRTSAWIIELDSAKNMLWNSTHGSYDYSYYEINGIKRVGERDFIIAGIVGDEGTQLGDVDCEPYPINSGFSAWIYRLYDPDVGIIKRTHGLSLKTYPNPAINQIFIELPEHNGKAEIEILDIFGNRIAQLKTYDKQTQVLWDCSNVVTGIYFYHAEIDRILYKGKILIE